MTGGLSGDVRFLREVYQVMGGCEDVMSVILREKQDQQLGKFLIFLG